MEKTTNSEKLDLEEQAGRANLLQHATSDAGALLHIVKSSLGAGVLAMPFAFKNIGLISGIFGACTIGVIVIHCTSILVDSTQSLRKIFNKRHFSYADAAEYAFRHGYKGRLKHHAKKARYMVKFFLFLTYYGCLVYYVLLISTTFKQVIDRWLERSIDIRIYTASLILFIYPSGIIRFLKYLVPFSAVANTFLFLALGMIFHEIFKSVPPIDSRPAIVNVSKWPLFIATSFASMEGIGTILPLENEMKNPTHLTHTPRLLHIGLIWSVFINIFVGFFGYLKYGDDVKGVVSLSLPDDWVSECVKVTVALVVLFTYGLQMTAPMEVIWDAVEPIVGEKHQSYYYVIRSILIVGSVLIAVVLPSVSGVINLIGSIGFTILGMFIPALIELVFQSEDKILALEWRPLKNILLMLLAVIFGCFGLYSSVIQLADEI